MRSGWLINISSYPPYAHTTYSRITHKTVQHNMVKQSEQKYWNPFFTMLLLMMWTTQKIISDIGIGFFSIIISFNYCFFLKQMFLSMIESKIMLNWLRQCDENIAKGTKTLWRKVHQTIQSNFEYCPLEIVPSISKNQSLCLQIFKTQATWYT